MTSFEDLSGYSSMSIIYLVLGTILLRNAGSNFLLAGPGILQLKH